MSSIYIHHTCILIYDFSLIALMGHLQPCLLHTRCLATFALFAFDISADIIFIFFSSSVTVRNVQFHLLWTAFERYEEHSSLSAFRNSVPHRTQNYIRLSTRLQAAEAPCMSSVSMEGVGGGGKETMCATPKVCTRKNIPKIIIQLLILPAIP